MTRGTGSRPATVPQKSSGRRPCGRLRAPDKALDQDTQVPGEMKSRRWENKIPNGRFLSDLNNSFIPVLAVSHALQLLCHVEVLNSCVLR